ncbi:tetratricopeptide repeat protein [Mesonia sp.]|nr:tetratricopeptide repeat protein [Mesonia sp.]MAN26343.1 hypothetical protein [Mesonia sp.]MBJ97478.1 hypothetical protein [Flavobacteriaceae bacterium]|tara:strand:- start:11787 stop:12662 length:876 start_codon:yes stop_codon:yes gene_type:complete
MKRKKMKCKLIIFLLIGLTAFQLQAQDKKEEKRKREAKFLAAEAQEDLAENNFIDAEANYRKAISRDPDNAELKYNLGTVYFNKEKNQEAFSRLNQSVKIAESKALKHRAYHNQGNTFMKEEKYEEAVQAYKNALRNDPTDDETRYNLAVAKEKAKKKQQDQEKQKDKDKEDNKEKDKNNEGNQDGEDQNKENKNQDNQGEEGKKEEDKEKENQQQKKEGEGDQKKEQQQQQDSGEKGDEKSEQPQPQEGKMSPQQIKNLLEAMENQEKEVQDKINAQRVKGQRSNTDKDW